MKQFKINNFVVSEFSSPFIIAEACDNHFGKIELAIQMIDKAKEAGVGAIKFQHHLPDEEMLPNIPMSDNFAEPLYEFLKKNALKLDQHIKLKEYCDKIGILYLCTPFSYKAAIEIRDLVPVFKIGSGEMTDIPSLEKISELGKGMIVSTGMSTFEEIDRTYNLIVSKKNPLALMNCISEYPPDYQDLNLLVIKEMMKRYPEATIGHSDHTGELYSCFSAITLGAKIIEKHVILDKKMIGPDQEVSIDFDELKQLVDGAKKIHLSLGSQKKVHEKEKQIRSWAFRSLVSVKKIPQNKIIDENDIWCKRPGTGIPSHRMKEVIGLKTLKEIGANQLICWNDLEKK